MQQENKRSWIWGGGSCRPYFLPWTPRDGVFQTFCGAQTTHTHTHSNERNCLIYSPSASSSLCGAVRVALCYCAPGRQHIKPLRRSNSARAAKEESTQKKEEKNPHTHRNRTNSHNSPRGCTSEHSDVVYRNFIQTVPTFPHTDTHTSEKQATRRPLSAVRRHRFAVVVPVARAPYAFIGYVLHGSLDGANNRTLVCIVM